MTEDAYEKLREFLDSFPVGFPKTESGVEMKILKKLYNEEEAKMAVLLPPVPTRAASIARRYKLDPKYVEDMLESMAKKALIFRVHRGGKTLYNAPPFMIGIYEYSIEKMDEELAKLYKERGNLENAVSAMEKAVELKPENKSYARTLEKYKAEMNQ